MESKFNYIPRPVYGLGVYEYKKDHTCNGRNHFYRENTWTCDLECMIHYQSFLGGKEKDVKDK